MHDYTDMVLELMIAPNYMQCEIFDCKMQSLAEADYSTVAIFSFTSTSYAVDEQAGPAVMVVELGSCDLTFGIDVTVETVGGGSATGILLGL